MPDWFEIDQKIGYGRGKEAEALAPPYDVYRLNATSQGDFFSLPNRIFKNVKCRSKPGSKDLKEALEVEKIQGIVMYKLSVDVDQYQLSVGDVLLNVDPVMQDRRIKVPGQNDDINAIGLISLPTNSLYIGVRLNAYGYILRLTDGPNVNDVNGRKTWQPTNNETGLPVICQDGEFAVGPLGATPARIPIAINELRPYGDKAFHDIPSQTRKTLFGCFVPYLPGFRPVQGDRLVTANDARYVFASTNTQLAGVVGTQAYLEMEVQDNG